MLAAHWTAWQGQTQEHSTHVFCVVLPPCSCLCPFSCSPDHCWHKLLCQQLERCCCCCFFSMLLKAVVGNTITYSERLPDMSFWSPACCVGVACHRPLVSPQWLATMSRRLLTDRCWLTNQQLSTTNLCRGPSRLTAFCVAVIELNRW